MSEGIFDRFDDYRCVTPIQAVKIERGWQDGKFGTTDHSDGVWLSLLAEEFGEAAMAMNAAQFDTERKEAALENLEVELIQVAALAVAWVEALRRRNDPPLLAAPPTVEPEKAGEKP